MNSELSESIGARDMLPQPELMAHAAEECTELAHALLNLRRVLVDCDPIQMNYTDAVQNVNEEWADVQLHMQQIGCIDNVKVMNIMHVKNARWMSSLIHKRNEEDRIREAKRHIARYV